MSTPYPPFPRRIWSLTSSGLGTTISADGDSGGWTDETPDFESALDLRYLTDLAVMVNVAAITDTPTMQVGLDVFDDQGNLYPNVLQTAAITAAGAAPILAGGLHGGSSAYLVLPQWGRINWSNVSGGTFTGVEISVYGR